MCVSLPVYVILCAFPSHLPKSLSPLTKEYRSKMKFLWVWKREAVCARTISMPPAQLTFYQTPGNSQWSPLEIRLPLISQSWTTCSCWWFWYGWNRDRKAGLKNWSFSLVLHFQDLWVSLTGCVLGSRESLSLVHTPSKAGLYFTTEQYNCQVSTVSCFRSVDALKSIFAKVMKALKIRAKPWI